MAGNKVGGKKAVQTIIRKLGEDHYRKIGSIGGRNGRGPHYSGGFANGEKGREMARKWGAVGGRMSRRRKKLVSMV